MSKRKVDKAFLMRTKRATDKLLRIENDALSENIETQSQTSCNIGQTSSIAINTTISHDELNDLSNDKLHFNDYSDDSDLHLGENTGYPNLAGIICGESNQKQFPVELEEPINQSDEENNIQVQLCHWSQDHNISHSALSALLKVLKPHLPILPLDARTLLSTPRQKVAKKLFSPGEYYHLGLERGLKYLLTNIKDFLKLQIICVKF